MAGVLIEFNKLKVLYMLWTELKDWQCLWRIGGKNAPHEMVVFWLEFAVEVVANGGDVSALNLV